MKSKFLTVVILASIPSASSAFAAPKNESDIKVKGETMEEEDSRRGWHVAEKVDPQSRLKWCQGSVPKEAKLNTAEISESNLKDGVSCLVDDIDGNGFTDFILYQPPYTKDGTYHKRSALVLFFKGKSIIGSQVVPNLDYFPKKDPMRKDYPEYRDRFGLIKVAAGDVGIVYFYSPSEKKLEEASYAYPEGYENGD